MAHFRTRLRAKGISENAINLIMLSWSGETRRKYDIYIAKYEGFCRERGIDFLAIHVNNVLEFLVHLFENGVTNYNTLNVARSAVSVFLTFGRDKSLGENDFLSRLLKGIHRKNPPAPRYSKTWDVNLVFLFLKSLGPTSTLLLKQLTLKTVMLLALVSGQRRQTLHSIKLDNIEFTNNGVTIYITDYLKQSRPGYKNPTLIFDSYEHDSELCIVKCLYTYLEETHLLRGSSKSLFISYIKPHGSVTRDTISRWLKSVLCDSGIESSFKAHSTRSASSSAAAASGLQIQDILDTAGWSNQQTFHKFYRRHITTPSTAPSASFAKAVLTNSSL